ncbi:hypothetical protein ACEPAF_1421 [Sanghuangporus sanghuang]
MGLSRKYIFDAVDHSLKRLRLNYIDVLQCYRFDPNAPIEETMLALHDVVRSGHVRYLSIYSYFSDIALAWVMNKDPVTAPTIGAMRLQNLMDLIDAVWIELTKEEMKYLEEPYQPMPVVGISAPGHDEE